MHIQIFSFIIGTSLGFKALGSGAMDLDLGNGPESFSYRNSQVPGSASVAERARFVLGPQKPAKATQKTPEKINDENQDPTPPAKES